MSEASAEKSTNVRIPPVPWALRAGFRAAQLAAPRLATRWALTLFARPPRAAKNAAPLGDATPGALFVDGRRIAVWRWEPPGAGPADTAYVVHGWGGSTRQMLPMVATLRARGLRVVAFDAPGHGASEGTSATIPIFARTLAAVIEENGPARAIVAHSLGAAASTLALASAAVSQTPGLRAVYLAPLAVPEDHFRGFTAALGFSPARWDGLKRSAERHYRIRWKDLDLVSRARGLGVPLLVVHDGDDRRVPFREGAALAAAWPGARLHRTSGLGHGRVLADAGVRNAVSEFLCEQSEDALCAGGSA